MNEKKTGSPFSFPIQMSLVLRNRWLNWHPAHYTVTDAFSCTALESNASRVVASSFFTWQL
jgi:hypothetical protein